MAIVITRLRHQKPKPWLVLALLVACQWASVGLLAANVRHNRWLFYQGGDETFFYTSSWVLAGGHLPESWIGYGWSYLISPIALAAGPSYLTALPALVLIQTILLLPIALYCVYAIGRSVGGERLGYVAAALWVVVPFAAIPLWDQEYHDKFVEQFLPQAFGLTGLGDFPSMVCALVAALFCVRALDGADPRDAVASGLAAGFAIGIKPSNALFLAGPLFAFVAARRFRHGLTFAGALLPALLALVLWKLRGLGSLPITTSSAATAAGAEGDFLLLPQAGVAIERYFRLDWSQLRDNYSDLRRFLWGVPIWQAFPLVGLIVAARRSLPKALLLGGWLLAFVLVKGSSTQASIEGGTLLRLFMPGLPPLLILGALALLVLRRRDHNPAPFRVRPIGAAPLLAAASVFAVVPMILFAALPPLRTRSVVLYFDQNVMVPVDPSLTVTARRDPSGVLVSWDGGSPAGGRAFYRVLRSRPDVPGGGLYEDPGREGVRCPSERPSGYVGALGCRLDMQVVGVARSTGFRDDPPAGSWVYRVGIAANWRDDPEAGDTFVVSGSVLLRARP